jgi:mannose-6-phosphate isomerase-like protein (cupin superfamily)
VNTEAFTTAAKAAGYTEFYERDLTDALGPEPHTHDFDARLLVTGGSIALTIDSQTTTYRAGDQCEVPRGTVHAEKVGPDGVKLMVAKRVG